MELIPYKSLEGVELSTYKDAIRLSLKVRHEEFRSILGNVHDSFDSLGLQVYYDDQCKCKAVQAAAPAQPSFQGVRFVGQKYSDLSDWLLEQDPELESDDSGVTSFKLGIALYIPDLREGESAEIESILLFEEGYYSQDQEQLKKKLLKAYGLADISEYTFVERMRIRIRKFLKC